MGLHLGWEAAATGVRVPACARARGGRGTPGKKENRDVVTVKIIYRWLEEGPLQEKEILGIKKKNLQRGWEEGLPGGCVA